LDLDFLIFVWGFFFGICSGKMVRGGMALLLGIFEFLVCFVMVNRGEHVAKCVVNVVR
jgi:hypothetical protein